MYNSHNKQRQFPWQNERVGSTVGTQCVLCEVKGEVHPKIGNEGPNGSRGIALLLLVEDGWSTPRPFCCTLDRDPVPTAPEAGWDPGPAWTGAENFATTGMRSPHCRARSKSLYRLSYPGPQTVENTNTNLFTPLSKVPATLRQLAWNCAS